MGTLVKVLFLIEILIESFCFFIALNLKSIKLIKGGLSIDASKKKDVESTSSDTYKP